jgi:SAM-dependent methyltransferase
MTRPVHPRARFARILPSSAAVLDVGCWQYSFARLCEEAGLGGLRHFGIDVELPAGVPTPEGYVFNQVDIDASPFPFPDQTFDAVVASHVIEHLRNPLLLLDEAFRVLKPQGLLYLECPSDRSLRLPSMPFKFEEMRSLNFYDDPTHVGRPHTPQSLHRLFRMYGAEVLESRYVVFDHVRWRSPWLILKALLRRDAAMLEDVVWKSVGFAVFGIGRKGSASVRRYVLSR